jgi:hypothetical protein
VLVLVLLSLFQALLVTPDGSYVELHSIKSIIHTVGSTGSDLVAAEDPCNLD